MVGYLPYLVLQCNQTNTAEWSDGRSQLREILPTDNKIGIMPDYDPAAPERTLLYSTTECTYVSSLEVLAAAKLRPQRPESMPAAELKRYDHTDKWILFRGWQWPHRYLGDPMVRRVHIFSRAMRQVPTGSNVKVKKARKAQPSPPSSDDDQPVARRTRHSQ